MPVSANDRLSPRQVRLSWQPIPEFEQNGELLFYEVRVVNPDQVTSRKKRLSLVPNSPEACFQAAGALPEFSVYVPGNETSVLLKRLSKEIIYISLKSMCVCDSILSCIRSTEIVTHSVTFHNHLWGLGRGIL